MTTKRLLFINLHSFLSPVNPTHIVHFFRTLGIKGSDKHLWENYCWTSNFLWKFSYALKLVTLYPIDCRKEMGENFEKSKAEIRLPVKFASSPDFESRGCRQMRKIKKRAGDFYRRSWNDTKIVVIRNEFANYCQSRYPILSYLWWTLYMLYKIICSELYSQAAYKER